MARQENGHAITLSGAVTGMGWARARHRSVCFSLDFACARAWVVLFKVFLNQIHVKYHYTRGVPNPEILIKMINLLGLLNSVLSLLVQALSVVSFSV